VLGLLALALVAGVERSEAQSSWQCGYDFAQGLNGWIVRDGFYTGQDVRSEPPDYNVSADPSVDLWLPNLNTAITSVRVFYESVTAGIEWYTRIQILDGVDLIAMSTNGPGLVTAEWTGERALNNDALVVWIGVPVTFLDVGSIRINRIALEGLGDSPCSRPPVTGGNWRCSYDFASGLGGWTIENGQLENGKVVSSLGGYEDYETAEVGFNAEVTLWLANLSGSVSEFTVSYIGMPSLPWWTHNIDIFDGQESRVQESNLEPGQNLTFRAASSIPVSNGGLRFTLRLQGIGIGYFAVSRIDMRGSGTNPCATSPGGPRPVYEFPVVDLYSGLADVNLALGSLPRDFSSSVPEPDVRVLFGYAKFLMSPAVAAEFGGPFEPIFAHMYIAAYLIFGLGLVYCIVWVAVWIFKFIVWFFKLLLQIIYTVVGVLGSVFKFLF
jgi:hypothetical protein